MSERCPYLCSVYERMYVSVMSDKQSIFYTNAFYRFFMSVMSEEDQPSDIAETFYSCGFDSLHVRNVRCFY